MHLPLKQSVILPDHPLWKWKPLADSRPWTLRLGKDKHRAEVFRMEGQSGLVGDGSSPRRSLSELPSGHSRTGRSSRPRSP
jgi:hypothetical protein